MVSVAKVGVNCQAILTNNTFTNTTQTISGCKITATNVTIQSNSNITFQPGDQGITINGTFNASGSTLQIKNK
jgi:hypothetical protein